MGDLVTQVRARDRRDPALRPTYSLPQGADYAQFSLDKETGQIRTRRPVNRGVNDTYELAVIAYGGGESRVQQISVLVSQRNLHPPRFTQRVYRVEAPVSAAAGTPLLQVRATDNDTVAYNRQALYSMKAPENASRYLTLDQGSGQISLRRTPSPGLRSLNVTVSARDLGSPSYHDSAHVQVTFRTISEPLAVRAVQSTNSSVYVCWRRPRNGPVSGYMLQLRSADAAGAANATRLVLRDRSQLMTRSVTLIQEDGKSNEKHEMLLEEDEECTLLDGLQPWTKYNMVVYGWREHETGMASQMVTFGTRLSPCTGNVCGNGTCRRSAGRPGYTCTCPEGAYGQRCQHVDPCHTKPCQNFGACRNLSSEAFECRCMAGFYGTTCADFNPCFGNPTPCLNGGTCHSNVSNTYVCTCPPLYRGDTCATFDPCASAKCRNGATCYAEAESYRCQCRLGYAGPHCELDLDFCASSPCNNGATCVDGATDYTCLCPAGFTGIDCHINIDDCAGDPCQHGGVCRDGLASFRCSCPEGYTGHLCQTPVSCPPELEDGRWGRLLWAETPLVARAHNISERIWRNVTSYGGALNPGSFTSAAQQLADVMPQAAKDGHLVRAVEQLAVVLPVLGDQAGPRLRLRYGCSPPAVAQVRMGPRLRLRTRNIAVETIDYSGDELLALAAHGLDVRMPYAVLKQAARHQRRLRLVVIAYRTSLLFPAQRRRVGPDPGVISVTIPGYDAHQLPEPVTFGFSSNAAEGFQPRCVYWNEEEMAWSTAGVRTEPAAERTVCSTSHLSSFSVLFDPVATPIGGLHERILSVLSYIGATLSLLGLALTILTYSLFRCLNRDRQGKILLNLCVSLLLMNAAFLVSNLHAVLPSAQFCISTAVGLLFAWGLPLAIVLSTLASDRRAYYQAIDEHYCVITARQPYIYYISFFGPGCVILVINVVVFALVARVLFQQRTLGKFGAVRKSISISQVRGAFTVMTLLGVTWVLGAFALGRTRLAFSYIFTILNSTQGFIIFVSRCLQYPEARLAWLTLIKTGRRKQRRGSAPSSSSQANKKSSLPSSRTAALSASYSMSSSSEGGWPGRQRMSVTAELTVSSCQHAKQPVPGLWQTN
ncbi:adhesion G protein-coupled receptor E1-like [Pollicipes pollicipes]|uniref:adhesion G protein-coupled receptor E1-like n=1 Tax=Pollicipes pollicipes TaxID=41117 RepID=UPI00188566DD|nr:adhesion G protein-coupled receptor E1-like [Pollicipes pollicipes]